jgi:hypothetical protein
MSQLLGGAAPTLNHGIPTRVQIDRTSVMGDGDVMTGQLDVMEFRERFRWLAYVL